MQRSFDVIGQHLSPDMTFIDLGAGTGSTSVLAAAQTRQVISIEPDLEQFARLQRNVAGSGHSNIHCLNCAVGMRRGWVRLNAASHAAGETRSLLGYAEDYTAVPSLELRAVVSRYAPQGPLFLRINIEGLEYRLLPTILPWLKRRQFVMHVATHPDVLEASIAGATTLSKLMARFRRRRAEMVLNQSIRNIRQIDPDASLREIDPGTRRLGRWLGEPTTSARNLLLINAAA